jgi:ferrochelatase
MSKDTIGIVLLNLGGPDSLRAVRPFLYNLFSDRDIIRLGPPFLQKPLAWLISTLRSKKAEDMYSQIGGKSPILEITTAQAEALEKELNQGSGVGGQGSEKKFKVYIGMRYWHPFMKDTISRIKEEGIRRLIVLSLYPHYSKATTGSSVDDFKKAVQGSGIQIRYIEDWPDFAPYIDALAALAAEGISEFKGSEFELLYSAHSLPQSFIDEGDPYLDHIKKTIEAVNKKLSGEPYNLTGLKSSLSFQSKTGPVKWLEPSTEEAIETLSKRGGKNLFVVPVSFVSDHIETLYEIDILYGDLAEKHGITLKRCKALNTSGHFIGAMKELVLSKTDF